MTGPHSHVDNDKLVIDRITVPEAAKRLGITQSAVHKRISRNQLQWEKDEGGRVFVFLDSSESVSDKVADRVNDRSKDLLLDSLRDQIAAYKDQVEYLKAELTRRSEEHREESRRKDHLLAAALERIPAIEPPQDTPPEPRESPTEPAEEEGKPKTPPDTERRSWWRRMFGT
jgi:hypothetical protein